MGHHYNTVRAAGKNREDAEQAAIDQFLYEALQRIGELQRFEAGCNAFTKEPATSLPRGAGGRRLERGNERGHPKAAPSECHC